MDQLEVLIIEHEGLRLRPYRDTVGKLTIGVGRNLDDVGISKDEALFLLENDLTNCKAQLAKYSWYLNLDTVRQGVLIELTFNIGISRVLLFKNMIESLKTSDYLNASKHLLDSLWAKQVGSNRSNNMAARLATGQYST